MGILLFNVQNFMSEIDALTESFLTGLGIWGAIISCFIITAESILPFLPLCVFVTIEFYIFGGALGFLLSWIFTCLGCFLAFSLIRSKFKKWFYDHFLKKDSVRLKQFMKRVDKMKLSSLAVLVAIPFTPAFLVNIACGLSSMKTKKFMLAIAIGKPVMVYFWGYIGMTLIECLTHPIYLIKVGCLVLGTFVFSKVFSLVVDYE